MPQALCVGLAGVWAGHHRSLEAAIRAFAGEGVTLTWALALEPDNVPQSHPADLWLLSRQDPHHWQWRRALMSAKAALSVIDGTDPALGWPQSLDALSPWLKSQASPGSGLFTRLGQRNAQSAAWRWTCDNCDDPDCEHRLKGEPTP